MQLFHFWLRDVHPVQNLLLCTKFHENQMIFHWDNGDITIFRNGGRPPSSNCFTTIRIPPYHPSLTLLHTTQRHCQHFHHVLNIYHHTFLISLNISFLNCPNDWATIRWKKNMRIWYRNVTDRQTDRQTDKRTDGRTDRFAISMSRVSVLTHDKNPAEWAGLFHEREHRVTPESVISVAAI